ncbi:UPAR/Ly6 domain-containing protein crim [Onthophagus taurus]|uniref:UPAR/Ly6 domain-containing protein crim n=1 Tax=Onthophagus taurus TaxID=166361 RepID=UPI000C200C77|nr:uncharacterized protein LOC111416901 [Onthophagus taurus]
MINYLQIIISILIISVLINVSGGVRVWCYQCVSTESGCGREFNWWWHWTKICPEDDDVCVKIEERKDTDEIITRACLSTIRGYRTDIPADHYEGCRPAAKDVRLGHYVNNSIKELDVHRNYFESVQYCFCFLDHRCNGSFNLVPNLMILIGLISWNLLL